MFIKIICVVLFANSALSRNVPSFNDLDEEDLMLFRAAYDAYETQSYTHENPLYPSYNAETPTYNIPYSHDDNAIPIGKLDLLKDGLWALKAKMKELKAFNKALAANLLSTKLKVKELLEYNMKPIKKHHHVEVDKKPVYNYQASTPPSYSQYEQPHQQYTAPVPQYTAPAPQYTAPAPQYTAPAPQYTASVPQYTAPVPQYTASVPQNTPTAQQYTAKHYGPQHAHDPYYGQ